MHMFAKHGDDILFRRFESYFLRNGRVSEWSNEAVLKTVGCKSSVGSNPTPSANLLNNIELWQNRNHPQAKRLKLSQRMTSRKPTRKLKRLNISRRNSTKPPKLPQLGGLI